MCIIAISGACRKQELKNINIEDIQDTGKTLIIKISNTKTNTARSFVVPETYYAICKKYINLRPAGGNTNNTFFLNYQNERCTKQSVGINKIGSVPKQIALFLNLPNANEYTGHCFRRSSATILVDAGGDLLSLKRHGGWQSSSVAEGYINESAANKASTANKIATAINSKGSLGQTSLIINSAPGPSNNERNLEISYNNIESAKNVTGSEPALIFTNCNVTINNYYNKI